jgi:hypothetical protein
MQTENMTWTEYIDRLLATQSANDYQPSWVIEQVENAGHPPWGIWRKIGFKLGYSINWINEQWHPQLETDEPDLTSINLEQLEKSK